MRSRAPSDSSGGFGPPLHVHSREDEAMYMLDGEIRFRQATRSFLAQLPFRAGRAISWLEDHLAPRRGRMSEREIRRLVLQPGAQSGEFRLAA